MSPKEPIRDVINFGYQISQAYVADLNDADLLVRSVPGSNHIAWQLGHLIVSTEFMLGILGQKGPGLPAGFEAAYTPETSTCDDPAKFSKKDEYLSLMESMKAASLAAVEAMPEESLGLPGPEKMREYAPTNAACLLLLGNHWSMHAGQFVPVRRKLGKAPLF